jgi:membrane dipeptidase
MDSAADAAATFLRDNLVWDNHGCMPLRPLDESFLPQLVRYKKAGVDAAFINIGYGEHPIELHLRMIAQFRRWLSLRPDDYIIIRTVGDIDRARREGKLAVGFDIEGARAIGDQLSLVQLYYDLGVRWMLIAYNRGNLVGGGCHDEEDTGLTSFGREVLDEMARIGMVACCTHTGPRTSMEVIAHSKNPVIFSHSNPRALRDHQRNISDEAMRACAATGGVVGINGVGIFLGENDISTETVVRHIDYAVSLIGIDHVGFGFDYVFDMDELIEYLKTQRHTFPAGKGYDNVPKFVPPEQLPEIIAALLRLGYKQQEIAKIAGLNLMRVARQVWK